MGFTVTSAFRITERLHINVSADLSADTNIDLIIANVLASIVGSRVSILVPSMDIGIGVTYSRDAIDVRGVMLPASICDGIKLPDSSAGLPWIRNISRAGCGVMNDN